MLLSKDRAVPKTIARGILARSSLDKSLACLHRWHEGPFHEIPTIAILSAPPDRNDRRHYRVGDGSGVGDFDLSERVGLRDYKRSRLKCPLFPERAATESNLRESLNHMT